MTEFQKFAAEMRENIKWLEANGFVRTGDRNWACSRGGLGFWAEAHWFGLSNWSMVIGINFSNDARSYSNYCARAFGASPKEAWKLANEHFQNDCVSISDRVHEAVTNLMIKDDNQ